MELARQHTAYLHGILPAAQDLHADFLAYPRHEIAVTDEASLQMFDLKVSRRDVVDILECCEPIACIEGSLPTHLYHLAGFGSPHPNRRVQPGTDAVETHLKYTMVLAGVDRKDRPVHVVCRFWGRPPEGRPWAMVVIGVYAPSVYRWHHSERNCFCEVSK